MGSGKSYSDGVTNEESNAWKYDPLLSYARQAEERIQEFDRLKKARHLLDAIFLTNELISDGSDVEILSLANTIITRFKVLGVFNTSLVAYTIVVHFVQVEGKKKSPVVVEEQCLVDIKVVDMVMSDIQA
ncbi:uncharacterized protein LOC117229318 [Megalopta genalis]|uniref:uncharacterized protein LOC117229318 n=1 Tax=Megalopta genalis TaxID=115081 RepID=UPI003FD4B630